MLLIDTIKGNHYNNGMKLSIKVKRIIAIVSSITAVLVAVILTLCFTLPYVVRNGKCSSTLILSPPGMGKTTLLRDMVRLLSDRYRFRVAVADERGEIAAMYEGRPGMDVGRRTDVLEGCGKAEGTMTLLRAMNPEIIAMDEITEMRDLEAIRQASYCGVKLLATVHAENREGLIRRPLYRELLALEVFSRFVTVENHAGERRYTVTDEEGALCCG